MAVHAIILDHVLREIEKSPEKTYKFLIDRPMNELKKTFFINSRNAQGFRLTPVGNKIFEAIFKSYRVVLDDKYVIKSSHYIFLGNWCKWPYYFDDRQIILYDADDAVLLKLSAENLDSFIKNWKSKNKLKN